MSHGMRCDDMVESALAASRGDGCVVLVAQRHQANLRWASNTLTTNGETRERSMTVVALHGAGTDASAASLTRTVSSQAEIADLVSDAEAMAAQTPREQSARALVAGEASPDFASDPADGGIGVLTSMADDLGHVLAQARSDAIMQYGYAEHVLTTTYLGTSAGVRARHVQPSGHLTITAKDADLTTSTWTGRATADFTDVDVRALDAELRRKLEWSRHAVDLSPGRYRTVLPPTAVADLAVYAYWEMSGLAAHEGRSVYAEPGRGTRVGQRMVDPRVTLRSDPAYSGLECADRVMTASSGPMSSVFDNGMPSPATDWMSNGVLNALVQTRHSAELTGLPTTPGVDNLVLEVAGAQGSVDDLVAGLDDGVLVTSLWYIREVDPQTLLLTGLTRDGVYVVRNGEVVGSAPNFRFNESPVDVLSRIGSAGTTVPAFSREWGEWFPRTAMPALLVDGFNFSTVSDAR
jgi:predicted Zn-dependent protease